MQADATSAAKNTAKKAMSDPDLVIKAATTLNDLKNSATQESAESVPSKPNKMD